MTWIKFAIWLCGIYTAYYAGVLFWDYIRSGKTPAAKDAHELTFVEDFPPVKLEADSVNEYKGSSLMSSGGVSLKQMFSLAREEAIEFTRAVSF
jgi:hypothetical protein